MAAIITMPETFPFSACKDWIRNRVSRLTSDGTQIEVLENSEQLPTLTVKVTSESLLADLVLWAHGRCSMQVFDLRKEKFVLELHDLDLTSDGYTMQIQDFFDLMAKSKGP
jgi:hypothetical protein